MDTYTKTSDKKTVSLLLNELTDTNPAFVKKLNIKKINIPKNNNESKTQK